MILIQPRDLINKLTVSHIYNFIYLSLIFRFLDPNSTPIVASCSFLNLESVNYKSMQLFPTSSHKLILLLVSPTIMNLKR